MHKTKKKDKAGKIPKPIKIKKEKTEDDRSLHPMSHYIDDRLELVKQIFGSLKPKTITNLAPDFLKKKSMDEIEELCLNELLCISTKRLLSIINSTKCPTDTESSGDSDVEQQEEHISLEEISSDSEIEDTSNAARKKSSGTVCKIGAKHATKNAAEKEENDGQISVLELLELQARARAIRSQLALEPVTKIEVDSDAEKNGTRDTSQPSTSGAASKDHKRSRGERKRKSGDRNKDTEKLQTSTAIQIPLPTNAKTSKSASNNVVEANTNANADARKENETQGTKRIKLKRNYRANNRESDSSNEKMSADNVLTVGPVDTGKEVKKETRSRSPTPDVIPIIPEQETLLISDSSDGEGGEIRHRNTTFAVSAKTTCEVAGENIAAVELEKTSRERKITEPEEGELIENENGTVVEKEAEGDSKIEEKSDEVPINTVDTHDKHNENKNAETIAVAAPDNILQKQADLGEEVENPTIEVSAAVVSATSIIPENASISQTEEICAAPSLEDDDRNDDVISLEGGDLEEEMIEHLEEDTTTKSSFPASPKKRNAASAEQDADVISLDSSDENERDKESAESWHSRYLKSSKVSKVLAASRLGKRVRDNIKKSKRSKNDSDREIAQEEKENPDVSYASKHEDGSMEQYKELVEMRQRKK